MKRFLVATAALSLAFSPALAQTGTQEGLVNVNIQDVLKDIAIDLNIQDANIPITIQLPVNVAANVCDVSVNVLSAQVGTGDASCIAVTGSQELTQAVQQEMVTSATTTSPGGATTGTDGTTSGGTASGGTTSGSTTGGTTGSTTGGTTGDTSSGGTSSGGTGTGGTSGTATQ